MNKAIATSALIFGAFANEPGVPPHSHNCATAKGAPFSSGLIRDYDLGGCKCADSTAAWAPHAPNKPVQTEQWSCYCQLPDMYESAPFDENKSGSGITVNDANRRKCGVIIQCQTAAVLQQKSFWATESKRLNKERMQAKNLNKKQLVKNDELNTMRHLRMERSKQNRIRARVALGIISSDYKRVKLSYVSGKISKDAMQKAHSAAASQVAGVRNQWRVRQNQINSFYENTISRTITMENFVEADQQKADQYFEDAHAALRKRYGERIDRFMRMPLVENVYKQWPTDAAGKLDTTGDTLSQDNSSVCPLYE